MRTRPTIELPAWLLLSATLVTVMGCTPANPPIAAPAADVAPSTRPTMAEQRSLPAAAPTTAAPTTAAPTTAPTAAAPTTAPTAAAPTAAAPTTAPTTAAPTAAAPTAAAPTAAETPTTPEQQVGIGGGAAAAALAAPVRAAAAAVQPAAGTRVTVAAAAARAVPPPRPTSALVVTARQSRLAVHASPGGRQLSALRNPISSGSPLTLLAVAGRSGWLQVLLPSRPNGSSGWVRESAVVRSIVVDALEISTRTHQVRHYRRGKLVATYAAATGTGGTPTPRGRFYLTSLLIPTNGGYGPYAYGLSAHSEVLNSFGGGNGQIGLHGTNKPGSIGRSASHGCVRLSTAAITALAAVLPLGTPVTIT